MAELDVEGLKVLAELPRFRGWLDSEIEDLQEMLPAIITALEDRDRLRAAGEEAEALLAPDTRDIPNDIHNDFVHTVRAVEVRRQLRAALEGRDG